MQQMTMKNNNSQDQSRGSTFKAILRQSDVDYLLSTPLSRVRIPVLGSNGQSLTLVQRRAWAVGKYTTCEGKAPVRGSAVYIAGLECLVKEVKVMPGEQALDLLVWVVEDSESARSLSLINEECHTRVQQNKP